MGRLTQLLQACVRNRMMGRMRWVVGVITVAARIRPIIPQTSFVAHSDDSDDSPDIIRCTFG